MAEQRKLKEPEQAVAEPKKKGSFKLVLFVGGLMAVEGVGVFFAAKMLGVAPQSAAANADGEHPSEEPASQEHGEPKKAAGGEHADKSEGHESAKPDEHGAKSDVHGGAKSESKTGKPEQKGSESNGGVAKSIDSMSEIELADCRLHNSRSGRMILVRIRVSALVMASDHERAKSLVEAKRSRIQDRISSVIRSAEPKYLNEAGLETLKRNLRHELGQVMGDMEIIKEILVPELLQT